MGRGAPTCWHWDDVSQLQVPDWEVDDGGILLPEEVVLGDALHVEDQIGGQLCQREPPPAHLDVVVRALAVKLVEQLKYGHLQASRWRSSASSTSRKVAQAEQAPRQEERADLSGYKGTGPVSMSANEWHMRGRKKRVAKETVWVR